MNISNIDLAPPESKAFSTKTGTEETDTFSILMASITAGNGIQQGNYNLTADSGRATLTGQVIFSPIDVTPTDQDASLASPGPFPVESSAEKGLTAQDTSSVFAIPDITERSNSNVGKTGGDGIMGEVEKAETVDLSNAKPLLPQAVKSVKEEDAIEAKEWNVKAGTIVSGNDEGETVKGLDISDGRVPALGRESFDPGLLESSAKSFSESDPVLKSIQRSQIDPVDLVAQVSGKIKADFNSEGGEVRMELHPESLGHLKIEIKVEGGVIRANILTENAMVKDTIDSNLSMLKGSLEEHGLMIDQLSVEVGHKHSGNAFAERKDIQVWQSFENADASRYDGEEPVIESWYSSESWNEQGVSIFA